MFAPYFRSSPCNGITPNSIQITQLDIYLKHTCELAWVIEGNLCNESEEHFNKKTPSTYFKSNLQIQYKSLHLSEIKKENLTLKSCIILAKLVSLVWPVNTLYSSHNWPEIRQSLGINWFSGNEHLISHWYLLTKGKEFNCLLPQMFIGKKSMTLRKP